MSKTQQGDALHSDVLARSLSYLPWTEVMKCRVVSPEWRNVVLVTLVQELVVHNLDLAHDLPSLAAAMPCLQKLKFHRGLISSLSRNRDNRVWPLDEILAGARGFQQLRSLRLERINAELRASPLRVMQLQHLETLALSDRTRCKWDLTDLSGTPRLKNLFCIYNYKLTGDLSSLQFLSQTLVHFVIINCQRVTGDVHIASA